MAGTLYTVGVGDLGIGDVTEINGFDAVRVEAPGDPDVGYPVLTTADGTTALYAIDLRRGEVIGEGLALLEDVVPPVSGLALTLIDVGGEASRTPTASSSTAAPCTSSRTALTTSRWWSLPTTSPAARSSTC